MSNKMKALIGGGLALLTLVLILVFTLGGKDDPLKEMGEDVLTLSQKSYEDLKNVKDKNDLKKVYETFLSGCLEKVPDLLVLIKKDVDDNYNGNWSKSFSSERSIEESEKMNEEYKEIITGFTTLWLNLSSLGADSKFIEKMEEIRLSMNDQDELDFISFTLNEIAKTGEAIANNPEALETTNQIVKQIAKNFGNTGYLPSITKDEMINSIRKFKKEFSGLTFEDIAQREDVRDFIMFIADSPEMMESY